MTALSLLLRQETEALPGCPAWRRWNWCASSAGCSPPGRSCAALWGWGAAGGRIPRRIRPRPPRQSAGAAPDAWLHGRGSRCCMRTLQRERRSRRKIGRRREEIRCHLNSTGQQDNQRLTPTYRRFALHQTHSNKQNTHSHWTCKQWSQANRQTKKHHIHTHTRTTTHTQNVRWYTHCHAKHTKKQEAPQDKHTHTHTHTHTQVRAHSQNDVLANDKKPFQTVQATKWNNESDTNHNNPLQNTKKC